MESVPKVLHVRIRMTAIGSRRNKSASEGNHLRVEPTRTHLGDQLGQQVGHRSVNLHLRAIGNGQ
eukprot:3676146-Amphidinium_carterae.1